MARVIFLETVLIVTELAYNLLRTLRGSAIAAIYERVWPLFHKDPIAVLPPEIMSHIFSYLTPKLLLYASCTSRAWRGRILDSRLWRDQFKKEGWVLDTQEIERFEQRYNGENLDSSLSLAPVYSGNGKQPVQTRMEDSEIGGLARTQAMQARSAQAPIKRQTSVKSESITQSRTLEDDEVMLDAEVSKEELDPPGLQSDIAASDADQDICSENRLMMYASPGHSRVNFHHIYKQKAKLEENWSAGRYSSFQLPHRDHPEDAHTECVYTIQYAGRYLVSGSRDRTLRIWDLDTQRLARAPLKGHTGSVLCLQFDDRKEEDIIISGSSDTHVIIWQFSSGKMIKQLSNAHRESVLNLRFDKRFLVTCSKDKTIKIWNRHALRPGDRDYPVKGVKDGGQCPAYIIDMDSIRSSLQGGRLNANEQLLLEPYTHLMSLDLHGAAVNAIQIYKDQLVSASGDRSLRLWDIHTGQCSTKIEAHQKGIACVQYDGKRIVSGSSDNTIRIWDPFSHAEVARLEGHSRLVRTLQAAFADLPGGREKLEAEALEVDRQWHIAKKEGKIISRTSKTPQANPGSRKPKDIRAVGAKIPPSGGGSRWGRIVSGSYDETVIIWKKNVEDEWVIGHRLRQEDALTAVGPPLHTRYEVDFQPQPPPQSNNANDHRDASHLSNWETNAPAPFPRPGYPPDFVQAVAASRQARLQHQQHPTAQNQHRPTQHSRQHQATASSSQASPTSNPTDPQTQPRTHQQTPPGGLANALQTTSQTPNPQPQTIGQPAGQLHNRPAPLRQLPPAPQNPLVNPNVGVPNARVFKLQFDARRIICCSQDSKIVGWDFANGDEQIIQCSRFFSAPQ